MTYCPPTQPLKPASQITHDPLPRFWPSSVTATTLSAGSPDADVFGGNRPTGRLVVVNKGSHAASLELLLLTLICGAVSALLVLMVGSEFLWPREDMGGLIVVAGTIIGIPAILATILFGLFAWHFHKKATARSWER